jgi:hypothetical protein
MILNLFFIKKQEILIRTSLGIFSIIKNELLKKDFDGILKFTKIPIKMENNLSLVN